MMALMFVNDASNLFRTLFGSLGRRAKEVEAKGGQPWLTTVQEKLEGIPKWTDEQWHTNVVTPMVDLYMDDPSSPDRDAAEHACCDAFKLWAITEAKKAAKVSVMKTKLSSPTKFLKQLCTRMAADADLTSGLFFDADRATQDKLIEERATETLVRHCMKPILEGDSEHFAAAPQIMNAVSVVSGGASSTPSAASDEDDGNLLSSLDDNLDTSASVVVRTAEAKAAPAPLTPPTAASVVRGANSTVLCDDAAPADRESTIILLRGDQSTF
jgi:hypothetical protein